MGRMGLSFARVYFPDQAFLMIAGTGAGEQMYSMYGVGACAGAGPGQAIRWPGEPSQYRQHICLQHGTVPPLVLEMTPRDERTQTRFALEGNRTSVANLFVPMGPLLCWSYSRTWGVGSLNVPK